MNTSMKDREIIRDYAKKYIDICNSERNLCNKKIWEDHNSLRSDRPIVMISP